MKIWKRLLLFGVIAIVMQLGVLLYLNNYKLKSYTAFNPTDTTVMEENKGQSGILMPESIDKIEASFDGKYCSYFKGDSIYVIDMQTGIRRKVPFDEGQAMDIYKWHDRKNEIIIGERTTTNGATKLKLTSYDAESGKHELVKDLSWIGNNISLQDMEFGSDNDIIATVVQNSGKKDLYYIGREISKVSLNTANIGVFKYTGKDKNLLYQDKTTNKYYITGSKKPFELRTPASKLLDIDVKGNAYTAEIINNLFSSVYYKDVNNAADTWHQLEMKQPISTSELMISSTGSIYSNDSLEGKFTDLKNNLSISYQGRYMSFFDGGIFTLKGNVLHKVTFEEANKN